MKAILLIIPLTGMAFLASAGEPGATNAPGTRVTLAATKEESPTMPAGNLGDTDQAAQRILSSGAITVKPLRSTAPKVVPSFNPFAPLERAPATPWLGRAPWGAAAESSAKGSVPVETRHEPQCGVRVCRL